MPSQQHEALIELFRHRPALATELLTGPLGIPIPAYQQIHLDSGELPDLIPTEYRADAVITLLRGDHPVLSVVIEVQLRPDGRKRRSWPVYLTTLHARSGCPVMLLVVCADGRTATWCANPITIGHPGWILTPLVVGPHRIPAVTDPVQAGDNPELAVLSALSHGAHPDRDKILHALVSGLNTIDRDHAALYADVVLAALPQAARHHLEALMISSTYEYQSDFARRYFGQGKAEGIAEGRTEGKAEGEATALLAVLAARGIDVSDAARQRITGCTDTDQLETWIRRATTAASINDILD
ncbi:hypothetical protein ACFFWC_13500 [Plantactinospora siamensis]|uniref:Transposase n=1 Tax=Plantactinospora siamensis TaxID=555372 RepID=A0ABV6P4I3_9ACTN